MLKQAYIDNIFIDSNKDIGATCVDVNRDQYYLPR